MMGRAAIVAAVAGALLHCGGSGGGATDGSSDRDGSVDSAHDAGPPSEGGADAPSDAGADVLPEGGDGDAPPEPGVVCDDRPAGVTSGARTVESAGGARRYRVFVPSGYDPTVGLPVVLNLHAYLQTAAAQAAVSEMDEKAEAESFIVVYPVGTGIDPSFNGGECCGSAALMNVDDVAYVGDVLDAVEEELCIDPDRVFATGLSNGGFMSHRLGCELSTRIAGIAPVAGAFGVEECDAEEPVLVIGFHGTSDSLVSYDGSLLRGLPSFEDAMAGWAERNGCSETRELFLENGDSTCFRYTGCPEGGAVAYCVVDGGGHAWPGGDASAMPELIVGKTTDDLSATNEMWRFFTDHTRP